MKTPGLYVPLDVNYVTDEGIRRAGPAAELLFIRALAYSKRTQSDGFLPDYDMPVISVGLPQVPQSIDSLVEWELWLPADGGWQIRSWQRWNETFKEAADKRKRAADRQRRSRERRAAEAEGTADDSDTHSSGDSDEDDAGQPPVIDLEDTGDVTRDSRVTHAVVTPLKRREEKRREEQQTSLLPSASPAAPSTTPPASRTTDTDDSAFDEFWNTYPLRKGKQTAVKAWRAAIKRGANPQHVIAAAAAYATSRTSQDPKYTKHPSTWLNGGHYDDEPDTPALPIPSQQNHTGQQLTGTDARVAGWYNLDLGGHE